MLSSINITMSVNASAIQIRAGEEKKIINKTKKQFENDGMEEIFPIYIFWGLI